MNGYVMLPCFTVRMRPDGEVEMTCNDVLGWVFEVFFAPFWNGKVNLFYPRKREEDGR